MLAGSWHRAAFDDSMLARKIAQADLDLDLPICDMPTWDSLPQRHRISAVPGKRGERWAVDQRPRTPLEAGPSCVLFPGGRIVVHRQSAPHSVTRMVRIESELGKGRAGWQLAGLAGWEEGTGFGARGLLRGTGGGFAK